MAKKEETQQGCLGTVCQDSTCLSCQVAQAERHHTETLAAIKMVANGLANVAEEIRAFRGVSSDTAQPARPAATPAKTETPTPAQATPAAAPEKMTIDTVRPRVLEWIKAHGRDKFVAVLAKFGASKLPDVKDADLPRLLTELTIAGSGQ